MLRAILVVLVILKGDGRARHRDERAPTDSLARRAQPHHLQVTYRTLQRPERAAPRTVAAAEVVVDLDHPRGNVGARATQKASILLRAARRLLGPREQLERDRG